MPYTLEYLHSRSKGGELETSEKTYRMGGAQLATMTFFAPTSLAIWIISLEVVPRTIESTRGMLSLQSMIHEIVRCTIN